MTYRITAEEENEIDQAFNDRDAARANARRLRSALDDANAKIDRLRTALEPFSKMADSFSAYKGDDWETKQTCFHFTIGDFRRAKTALEQS